MKQSLISLLLFFAALSLSGCSSLVAKEDEDKTVKEFYAAAKDAFNSGQWDTAIENYEKLKAYYPYGQYAEQSYLELAYAYYRYEEPESAQRELQEFIRLFPKHRALPYAYYLKALATDAINKSWLDDWITDPARRDMASTREAFQGYFELLSKYPKSPYAAKARERIIALQNRLARHEFQVAKYYFDRQAYLAATTRVKALIENYPNAQTVMPALALMRDAYTELGMTQNATDTQSVIDYNLGKHQVKSDAAADAAPSEDSQATQKHRWKQPEKSWWDSMLDSVGDWF
ncbi:outer membrane protein assembly factor BamD [Thiomicrospira sp. WB1]|uniref:outer membrane protein assembly factor BamD n=1 Tax=Thiomicrospira sp. WB1 TaxID=1685380 RepID=UPI000749CE19|nr:outer membrane protein assembly factor BamD [Thiomicrospira sp. WB1]KUJ71951.1 competence protein ComL [Thiomicrospira sp. WB1]